MMTLPPRASSARLARVLPLQPVLHASPLASPSMAADPSSLASVAIVIVAYNAEQTIESVLERIPRSIAENVGAILVSDDASADATTEVARRWAAAHPAIALTVVGQRKNLGYGGNQKYCYRWALDHGMDIAVMVHGDGQYAPELIGSMVEPLLDGRADAVFGSRMMTPGGARRGGMPVYKWIGNRILTTMQNLCAGLHLSEWHSGYRAYDLRSLDMDIVGRMSDVFHFDTEIILDLAKHERTIMEIPIPTFYGEEKCNVNGMRYALDVLTESVKFRVNRSRTPGRLVNAS